MLIQEIFKDNPWKMLIGCMMLNQTKAKQVRQVIFEFFEEYPDEQAVLDADEKEMVEFLRPLGLYNRRTKNIKNFTYDWIRDKRKKDVTKLRGIGKYGADSYEIFVNENFNVKPMDKVLIAFLEGKKGKKTIF
jgi:methyl-CpG-binding domain protein 4